MTQDFEPNTTQAPGDEQAQYTGGVSLEQKFDLSQIFAVLLTGLSIGWLVGLSISPVVGAVVGSLLALAGAMVAAFRGGQTLPLPGFKQRVNNAWPIALLALGVALGASGGNFARTNDLLGNLEAGQKSGTGKEQVVGDQLGQIWSELLKLAVLVRTSSEDPANKTGLFGKTSEECSELLATGPRTIRKIFNSSKHEQLQWLGEHVEDPQILLRVAEALCRK